MIQIILDFETSGLNPYHDDIIEIALKEVGTDNDFTCLLRPKSNECISLKITQITGITNKMLFEQGLRWEDAYEQMNQWLVKTCKGDKCAIISHNGESFDFIFLRRIFNDLNHLNIKPFKIHKIIFIDTLLLAKRLISGRMTYNQTSLCNTFNIQCEGSHRAMNDVIALEQLFNSLADMLNKELNKRRNVFDHPQSINDYITFKI